MYRRVEQSRRQEKISNCVYQSPWSQSSARGHPVCVETTLCMCVCFILMQMERMGYSFQRRLLEACKEWEEKDRPWGKGQKWIERARAEDRVLQWLGWIEEDFRIEGALQNRNIPTGEGSRGGNSNIFSRTPNSNRGRSTHTDSLCKIHLPKKCQVHNLMLFIILASFIEAVYKVYSREYYW